MSFQNKIEPSIVEDPNLIKDKGPSTFVRFLNFEKFFIKGKEHFLGSSLILTHIFMSIGNENLFWL